MSFPQWALLANAMNSFVDLVAKEKQQAPAAIEKFTKQIRVAVDAKKQISVK